MIDITNVGTKQTQFLRRAYEQKRLAHSYLFVDSDESRALNTAYWLACLFNCTGEISLMVLVKLQTNIIRQPSGCFTCRT